MTFHRCFIAAFFLVAGGLGSVRASESRFVGPSLTSEYDGELLIANSRFRYTGDDRLTFSSETLLASDYPDLLVLRSAIDTWASRMGVHPRVLATALEGRFAGSTPTISREHIDVVVQVATGLSSVFHRELPHPLAATRALLAVGESLEFAVRLPPDLAVSRQIQIETGSAPLLFGFFQPPWKIGETWAGGGAHSGTSDADHNALDFWGEYRPWGADVSQWWVSAMQSGTVRVWSSCSLSVVHANGWVTDYYHLDNIQLADFAVVPRNAALANYADNVSQALCQGGFSSGPHVHMSVWYEGMRVLVDESRLDFTAFSHHVGVGAYDSNCSRSWYDHQSIGIVCPNYRQLLNDAQDPGGIFFDGFESGDASSWSGPSP